MKQIKGVRGFTLIELMIVLAIIAIISSIAYPSYRESVFKANRADAMDIIGDTAGKLERCMTTYGAYNNASCTNVANGTSIASKRSHYNVVVTSTASTYSLTASPQSSSPQSKDTKCATFTLTSAGVKSSTPTGNTCW